MLTGKTNAGALNYQINAGIWLKNVDIDTANDNVELLTAILEAEKDVTKVLGATSGGGSFTATPTTRNIEVDGSRGVAVGETQIDAWEVKMTTTLREMTPENLKMALTTGAIEKTESKTTIKVEKSLKLDHYIPKICWVGDLNNGDYMVIQLHNVLSLSGANFTFADKAEGSLSVEFLAHQSGDKSNFLPFEIYIFGKPADALKKMEEENFENI